MTKHEAAIVTAYTQIFIGDISEYQAYAEKLLGRPLFTHELSQPNIVEEIRKRSADDFKHIAVE